MKISFSTLPGNFDLNVGYGYAGYHMVKSLQALGHQVPFQDPTAPVQIHFSQPEWYEFDYEDQYKIGYTPWESTELAEGWLEDMNYVDEIWTPSPVVAEWFANEGITVPIHVYEHGVEEIWSPKRRRPNGPLRFFHHGEPAPRKEGQMTLEAFHEVFGNDPDYQLTIKSYGASTVRVYEGGRKQAGRGFHADGIPQNIYPNVKVNGHPLEVEQLVALYHSHHVNVYPSWGEGFGLIPLQSLATGMPTICTEAWAPYARFLLPGLNLKSDLVASPWPDIHPGKMFQPDFEDLKRSMKDVADNYNIFAGKAYRKAFQVHQEYNWKTLTENAFAHIVTKFS